MFFEDIKHKSIKDKVTTIFQFVMIFLMFFILYGDYLVKELFSLFRDFNIASIEGVIISIMNFSRFFIFNYSFVGLGFFIFSVVFSIITISHIAKVIRNCLSQKVTNRSNPSKNVKMALSNYSNIYLLINRFIC